MFEKATAQRISRETFDGIWKILTTRPEVVAEPDHNCKQFKAEKMTWEHLCGQSISSQLRITANKIIGNGQKFPGVDPRSLSNFESHQPFIMSQPPPSRPPCPVGSAILVGEEVEMNRSDAPANTVSFAARIMEEVGYNEGQGFGKDRTGRSSIIEVKQLPPRVGPGIPTAKSRKAMKKEKRRAKRKATLCEHSDEKRAKHKQEVKDLGRTSGTGSKSLVNFSNEIDDSTDTGSMDRNVEILKGKRAGHARMQKDVTKKARLGVRIDDHSQG